MDNLIKMVLKDVSLDVPEKEYCSCVLHGIMDDFKYVGSVSTYDINDNGKWSIEVLWMDHFGRRFYTFCINVNWFPVDGFIQ